MKPKYDSFTVILRSGTLSAHVHCFLVPRHLSTLSASFPKRLQKAHGSPGPWAGCTSCTCGGGSAEGDVSVPAPAGARLRVPGRVAPFGCSRSPLRGRLPHGGSGSAAVRAPPCGKGGTARPVTQPCSFPLRATLGKRWVCA